MLTENKMKDKRNPAFFLILSNLFMKIVFGYTCIFYHIVCYVEICNILAIFINFIYNFNDVAEVFA